MKTKRRRIEMTNEKQWMPPGFRACTWDEAQRMNENGDLRMGIHGADRAPHPYPHPSVFPPPTERTTWLCIDTPKPQHTDEKPWVKMGFEECGRDEAPMTAVGSFVAAWTYDEMRDMAPLRPSPLLGLKRALDLLVEKFGESAVMPIGAPTAMSAIRAEIAKYEPPVCGECGRVK